MPNDLTAAEQKKVEALLKIVDESLDKCKHQIIVPLVDRLTVDPAINLHDATFVMTELHVQMLANHLNALNASAGLLDFKTTVMDTISMLLDACGFDAVVTSKTIPDRQRPAGGHDA